MNLGANCKPGFVPITSNWQDCKIAAVAFGFSGDRVAHVDYQYAYGTRRPKGCFQSGDNKRFHFNKGMGGSAVGLDKILCKSNG